MELQDKLSDENREESQNRIEESAAEKEAARREADRAETKYGGLIETDGDGE
jgi:predicted secreted Zn-dependent protease